MMPPVRTYIKHNDDQAHARHIRNSDLTLQGLSAQLVVIVTAFTSDAHSDDSRRTVQAAASIACGFIHFCFYICEDFHKRRRDSYTVRQMKNAWMKFNKSNTCGEKPESCLGAAKQKTRIKGGA
eukprot:gnl/MRDRNA2_/MRDRNA2_83498_c0_seq1.p1 gnl/MRDRNA2_/MRDRNA2_83498_c0~~gnl/MRDRNA2_/MRDRNA2_83498_c0_seq1.p1  ORF type:complete len:124 (+),score=13.63 gnl/MRDRNA2_/MRDRNA2_83498_c0_seq1:331-702(+)